jgi:hypothetical protein
MNYKIINDIKTTNNEDQTMAKVSDKGARGTRWNQSEDIKDSQLDGPSTGQDDSESSSGTNEHKGYSQRLNLGQKN